MNFHPPLRRSLSFSFASKPPWFHYFHSHSRDSATSNEILTILETVDPMEYALDRALPYLNPGIVTSVVEEEPNRLLGFRFFIWTTKWRSLRCPVARNLVMDMLVKDNGCGFELYWRALEQLRDRGLPITSYAFTVLIKGFEKLGMAEKAVESFGRMRDFNCKPNLIIYNTILHIVVQKQVYLLALAVYNEMLKSNYSPSVTTYNILIGGLFKSSKIKDALKMFDEMTQRGLSPNEITHTIIISSLCQAKRLDEAHSLFNRLKVGGRYPDSVAYNALLNGYCKLGRIDEAYAFLRSSEKERYVIGLNGYSCFIDGLFRAKRYDEAHGWYRKMIEAGVKPDIVLYTIMVRGLVEEGRINDALNLLHDTGESGLVPDAYCYNAVIKGFCDVGLLNEARSLHLEISTQDFFPNACTSTILICAMCRNGLVGEAQQIFNEMDKLGCAPSVVTFNALIHGLCKAGKLEEAHLLFYKMEVGRNPSLFLRLSQGGSRALDTASLQMMVEQLCESGLILKAYKLLRQLADSGVMPDIVTYNSLINGFCKAGNINGALKLFKDMQLKGLSPDSVTYGTLIDGLQRVDREEDAFVLFDQMVKNGCTPSSAVYKSLMTWSCRRGKVSLAFRLWLTYQSSLPGRNKESMNVIEEQFNKGELEKAIRALLEMDFRLKDFDLGPYTILLIGLCQARRLDEALAIFSVLEEYKVNVTPPSCVKLILGLCESGSLDLAINVFLYTLEKGFMMPKACNLLIKCLLRSQNKRDYALDLVSRMNSFGYDVDAYLYKTTKFLLQCHLNKR
ncbi:Tetratricopeptide-like helical domain containing protein [Trema orientale]|uniref:Tetratricopeptide-like helical domain containing protein n=1 Tax=Trema orientale TaxID=63057 RepID=A0A2P5API2_TREOI|nr:Tetratricopeptide-like helical domain containing protein [Trema orientale]